MIPRTIFEPEHELFRENVRRFLETEAVPYQEQWEEDGKVSRELWRKAGEQGFLCPLVAEEYGGVAADFRYNAICAEEIARLGLSGIAWTLHSDIVVPYIENNGSDYLKQKYLPKCVSGEIITAIAMSEPGIGSDLQSMTATAELVGDEYVINGSKTFITNGQLADLIVVAAKTDPSAGGKGISLLLVEDGMPGFEKGKILKKVGMKAQDTSELFFNDVRVPKENLLGQEGQGFMILMQELAQERLSTALCSQGVSEAVLQQTVDYVKERKAFGKPLATFQNTQFKLAELDAEVSALRVYVDHCLALHVEGKLDSTSAAKVKLLTSELQGRVVDECVQLHGGYGYMWEYPVARAYADSRVSRIFAGTSEVMKLIIGRELLGA
ncbi:acyl-CoA dehydrogenase family protein [Maricurvus nonylphenolicus]|uniref:acyl-CoA dehydrogenase family protein n=1 Tax=Maricurvus nonylphenolicus TaxID=1008307 RepID=UPI0036F343E5